MIKKYSKLISSLLASGFLVFSLQGCQSKTSDYADTQRLTQSAQISDNTAANQENYSDNSSDSSGSRLSYDKSDTQYTTPDDFSQMRDDKNYGESQVVSYYSSTVGRYRNANVILPYNYDSSKSYPVLYLLHGMGGNYMAWEAFGCKYTVQNAVEDYGRSDMIIVCPTVFTSVSGEAEDGYSFSELTEQYDNCLEDIVNDLMPYINENFSTKTGRDYTAIAGFSLGGREALYVGYSHPELFGYIGAFSPVQGVIPSPSSTGISLPSLLDDLSVDASIGQPYLNLLVVGYDDPFCLFAAEFYDSYMTEHGIDHIFYEMEGAHDANVWSSGLYNFARRIF